MSETNADRELVITRVFDAPPDVIWKAWTEPEHFKRWWGPKDYTAPHCTIDLRVGGAYRLVNRIEGQDFPFKGVYREVSPPSRVVRTQIFDVEPWSNEEAVVTTVFDEIDGKTRLTSTMWFPSKAGRNAAFQSGMEKGAGEAYDRLEQLLGELA
jgi:uncharacterized protein YndB with AHSA1/START domain